MARSRGPQRHGAGPVVTFLSFGFKHGVAARRRSRVRRAVPAEPAFRRPAARADRPRRGRRATSSSSSSDTREFLDRTRRPARFLLPRYAREGKSYLTVAIGCTGGRHRSVAIAEALAKRLRAHRGRAASRQAPGHRQWLTIRPPNRRRPRRPTPLIGVVVVTHGQLATELVNAAEMIVGDLPRFAAVSIGWHDDVEAAREAIAAAIDARASRANGVLLLTDMFGGTPSNLGDDVPRRRSRRGHHRRQPADAASSSRASGSSATLADAAREMRESGRNAIWVASELMRGGAPAQRMISRSTTVSPTRSGMHARAAAPFVRLAGERSRRT